MRLESETAWVSSRSFTIDAAYWRRLHLFLYFWPG